MDEHEHWTAKDSTLGVLFTAMGLLITSFAFLAMRNGAPIILWGLGWLVGPLLLILGGIAICGASRSLWRNRGSS